MTRALFILAAAIGIAASGTALAAAPGAISVSPASPTAGVATLELVDPVNWSGRSVPTRNGVHYGLCDRGPLLPCSIRRGAFAARRQALKLAQAVFRDTDVDLVVVGLPQSRTRHLLLVFERDLLGEAKVVFLRVLPVDKVDGVVRFTDRDLHGDAVAEELVNAEIGTIGRVVARGIGGNFEFLQRGRDVGGRVAAFVEVGPEQFRFDATVFLPLGPVAEVAVT